MTEGKREVMDTIEQQTNELSAMIGVELASGQISFPTFLDASLRIKKCADDPDVSLKEIADLIQTEPLLAARVIRLANSALLNPGGKPITAIGAAVVRIGLLPVRTLAFVVAAQQLESDFRSPALKLLASALWLRSIDIATRAHVVARHLRLCAPDKALLVGMLRSIGEFYLLARISAFPDLAAQSDKVRDFIATWREPVGAAVLEAFELPTEILESVEDSALYGGLWPPNDVGDLLFIASLSAEMPDPFDEVSEQERHALLKTALREDGYAQFQAILGEADADRRDMIRAICG